MYGQKSVGTRPQIPTHSDGPAWQTKIETLTQVVSEKIVNGPTKVVNHNILTVVVD